MTGTVTLLRPYVPSRTLRAMAHERRIAAVQALTTDHPNRYLRWTRFRKQAEELDKEAQRAEHWETECELSRRATARLLERALEVTEREGALP